MVMKAIQLLQKHGVPFNVLACVTRESSKHPLEIYRFFKQQRIEYVQYIPIVERLPDATSRKLGLRHASPPSLNQEEVQRSVSEWTVEPEAYGRFLIQIFDEWVRKDVGSMHVMNFEWALSSWMGLPSTICIFSEQCGRAAVMEHNGNLYSCDHYVYPDYLLGNIMDDSLREMIDCQKQNTFGASKKSDLPKACRL